MKGCGDDSQSNSPVESRYSAWKRTASFFSAVFGAMAVGLVSWFIGGLTGARPPSRRSTVVEVRRGPDGRWGA